jgi:signal transduction histidine kinase
LAAQLAHEIGTQLGSVSGHLQLAMASAECPASLRDRLVIATQEIARVSRIIRDYLDSTRRIDPTVTTVSVDRTIHEAVEVARGGNNARSAEVHIEVAPDAAAWRTDEGVARQIIVNLVANALDAVSTSRDADHAGVTVRASAEDSKTPGRRDLVVRISDTGPGLSQEAVGRLFEPFYTTKGRGKGTGLGLAICRELAQSLGGKIEGASEPGHGTTFTVRIPNGDEVARRAQVVAVTKPVVAQLVERTPG